MNKQASASSQSIFSIVAKCLQVEESVRVTDKWVLSLKEDGDLSQVSTQTARSCKVSRMWSALPSETSESHRYVPGEVGNA